MSALDDRMVEWAHEKREMGYSYDAIAKALLVDRRTVMSAITKKYGVKARRDLPPLENPNLTGKELDKWLYERRAEGYSQTYLSDVLGRARTTIMFHIMKYERDNRISKEELVYKI